MDLGEALYLTRTSKDWLSLKVVVVVGGREGVVVLKGNNMGEISKLQKCSCLAL